MKFTIPTGAKGNWRIVEEDGLIQLQEKRFDSWWKWMDSVTWDNGTHQEFISEAKGDILMGGLGLGYDVWAIKDKPEVKKIDVVEMQQEVIDLVWKHTDKSKAILHHDKLLNFMNNTTNRYDLIWIDIFLYDPFDKVIKAYGKPSKSLPASGHNYYVFNHSNIIFKVNDDNLVMGWTIYFHQ